MIKKERRSRDKRGLAKIDYTWLATAIREVNSYMKQVEQLETQYGLPYYRHLPATEMDRLANSGIWSEIVREELDLIIWNRENGTYRNYYVHNDIDTPSDLYLADDVREAHRELAQVAVKVVHDQKLLAEVIRLAADNSWTISAPPWVLWNQNNSSGLACAAMLNFTSQELLVEIVRNPHSDSEVICTAIGKLDNQDELLAELVWTPDRDPEVIDAAVNALHDESLLTAIAIGFPNREVAENAVLSIQNPEKLAQISQQAKDPSVRGLAESRHDIFS